MRILLAILGVLAVLLGLALFVFGIVICVTIIGIPVGLIVAFAGFALAGFGGNLVIGRDPREAWRKAVEQRRRLRPAR